MQSGRAQQGLCSKRGKPRGRPGVVAAAGVGRPARCGPGDVGWGGWLVQLAGMAFGSRVRKKGSAGCCPNLEASGHAGFPGGQP